MNGRRTSGKLGSKPDNDDKEDALSAGEVTRYKRIAARANFLAQDRMDIAYASKEATRRMIVPTTDDWNKLVRLERYLARYPRVVNWNKYQNASEKVVARADSDWARCRRTRRSTSGGCIHMLKFWSKTQTVVTLSSAEAELGAAVKASQEVLGMMSLWKEIGETTRGHVMGDASAAIGIVRRMVLGKVRHLNTSWLWVQEKEASRELQYHKVKGSDNNSDLFTKALDHDSIRRQNEANSCLGSTCIHCQQFECNTEHGEIGNGTGEAVRDTRKNGRVTRTDLAQKG